MTDDLIKISLPFTFKTIASPLTFVLCKKLNIETEWLFEYIISSMFCGWETPDGSGEDASDFIEQSIESVVQVGEVGQDLIDAVNDLYTEMYAIRAKIYHHFEPYRTDDDEVGTNRIWVVEELKRNTIFTVIME